MRFTFIFFITFIFSTAAFATTYTFPKNFQWCVATAGHQVEGDNINSDWWEWEKTPGRIRNGDRSGKASFHMERLEEDVQLIKQLGVTMYRFSIEWSRIEPRQGEYDPKAIAYYHRELQLLAQNHITPFVTIHHFVQPQWFTASGGWKRDDSPDIFLKYVEKIEAEYGKEINYWVTFNEPTVLLMGGFGLGVMPPGDTDWDLLTPMTHILEAHAKAYKYLHAQAEARKQNIQIGFAFHIRPLVPGQMLLSKFIHYADFLTNWNMPLAIKTGDIHGLTRKKFLGINWPWFSKNHLDEIKNTQDFLGINYYTREYISLSFKKPYLLRDPLPGMKGTVLLNWGIDPKGFYVVLKKAHSLFPDIPFIITENGLNDPEDKDRADYIRSHLAQLNKAMVELPHQVEGYCHWTLMDNFEWIEGFTPRFGLYQTDYKNNGQRTLRASGEVAKGIFKSGTLEYSEH